VGFSVGIAAFIVLIGFVLLFSSVCTVLFSSVQQLSAQTNEYVSNQMDKINSQIQLSVDSVSTTNSAITVKNVGTKTIFLENSNGYSWNTIIISYGRSTDWHTYSVESYTVNNIKVTATNATLNLAAHSYINPGEQARITLNLPSGAPEIQSQDIVSVTFASHYGTTASSEGGLA
jgi:archaellum component FlaF (FlaF/FlaG flagellin family)